MTLQHKTAIITGANRGIGRAIAIALASQGASCVLCARDEGKLASVEREITSAGGSACSISRDLRVLDAPSQLVDFAIARYGRIDIVVNNAGATKRGEFLELSDEDFLDGFALKYFAAVRLVRTAWPWLQAAAGRDAGIQVNAINPGAIRTARLEKRLATLAADRNITIEAAERAVIETEQVTRVGEPEDIAHLVVFLVSPQGRFLLGARVVADGGATKTI